MRIRNIKKLWARIQVSFLFVTGQLDNYIMIPFSKKDITAFIEGEKMGIKIHFVGIDKYMMLSIMKTMGKNVTNKMIDDSYAEFKDGFDKYKIK